MRKAFSLYELIIVMSIIIIITAITIPMIRNYLPSLKLSSSAKAVSTKLRQAQEEAVTTQIKHGVRFDATVSPPAIKFIQVTVTGTPPTETESTLETVILGQGIILDVSAVNNRIVFLADGGLSTDSSPGDIIVKLEDATKKINVSAAGVIKLQ